MNVQWSMRMKSAVVSGVICLALVACTTSGRGSKSVASDPSASAPPQTAATPVSARVELPVTTIKAGTTVNGEVVVVNDTGKPIETTGCGSVFQVGLRNDHIEAVPSWAACGQQITIPVGESRYPVTVTATYAACGGQASPPLPPCAPRGMPPLPPGRYEAALYQAHDLIPAPPTIPIDVTP